MDYISTTDLRTKTLYIREALEKGDSVYLVHRSKVIGVIAPVKKPAVVATEENLRAIAEGLSTGKKYTHEEREQIRRKMLEEKYEKSIS